MDEREDRNGGPEVDMSTVMTGAFHDIKNALGALSSHLHWFSLELSQREDDPLTGKLYDLEYEARRINNDLVRLITLYRISEHGYSFNPRLHLLEEFLEELSLEHRRLLAAKGIEIGFHAPDALSWHFDRLLVAGALANAVNNAYRYARGRVRLSAREEEGWLVLRVEDDGPGYPSTNLEELASAGDADASRYAHTSTGFGLYFAAVVARLHESEGRRGRVEVTNGGEWGGALFALYLP